MRAIWTGLSFSLLLSGIASGQAADYLSDRKDLIMHMNQGWGRLGIDCAAHARDQVGLQLRIGDKKYPKGLGHHAPGELVVDLGRQYARFEAEVGVQSNAGAAGSVVFQIFVDDRPAFDSGVLRAGDAPKPVSVSVTGALEMRLVVTDAGDGLISDCANWAEPRLIRDGTGGSSKHFDDFDVVRFARVVTSDPNRIDGARSTRIQEYQADDLYLDTDLYPDEQGRYEVPAGSDGRGAIGLRWIERRQIRALEIEFDKAPSSEQAESAEVQFWAGISAYQGSWNTLNGVLVARADRWTIRVDRRQNPGFHNGTWKVRWVIPAGDKVVVRRLQAYSVSAIRTDNLLLHLDSPAAIGQVEVEMYNGEFVEPATIAGQTRARIDAAESIPLKIRHIDRRSWQSDRAVLRIHRPEGSFAVGLDDVLKNKAVYVPEHRAMVSLADAGLTLAACREQIAGKETILQQVRRLPDQTFAQAIEKVHRVEQNRQPTMLSLACDNNKFIVHRDGVVAFSVPTDPDKPTPPDVGTYPSMVRSVCGSGRNEKLERHLDGGWYPVSVVTIEDGGIRYRQTAFVVPFDREATVDNPWLNPKPLFVAAYVIENTGQSPADALLRLDVLGDAESKKPAEMQRAGGRVNAQFDGRLLGSIDIEQGGSLKAATQDGTLSLTGRLEAGQTVQCAVYLPGWKMGTDEAGSLTGG
ncbi:MAG TPA: NPCBM/NEW2 domain-containing protein, partial [Phycisphaerae bacterium]|nr:NPCBM/NEW2 domain-containing protein [Phycisphaerae bacterium]